MHSCRAGETVAGETVAGIRLLFVFAILFSALPSSTSSGDERQSKLVRSLTGRSEAVRMRALRSVSDPAMRRSALNDLIEAAKQHSQETESHELARQSTVALIYLIGRVNAPEAEGLLIELLDANHLGIAMVSADALGKNKFYGAIEY